MKSRLTIESETIEKMIALYCKRCHKKQSLCDECRLLLDYSVNRLQKCRFGEDKPTCKKCPTHCYKKEEQEKIRQVMRYAGKRLLWRHPYLVIRYLNR
jgi:hypothetical protein